MVACQRVIAGAAAQPVIAAAPVSWSSPPIPSSVSSPQPPSPDRHLAQFDMVVETGGVEGDLIGLKCRDQRTHAISGIPRIDHERQRPGHPRHTQPILARAATLGVGKAPVIGDQIVTPPPR